MPLDLTNRRDSLLAKAKSIIKYNPAVMFAFADINCSLGWQLVLINGVQKLVALIISVCVYQNVNWTTITCF